MLTELLQTYLNRHPDEEATVKRFNALDLGAHDSFVRDHFEPGHITASAMITSPTGDAVLLTHHKKLGRWLQLGGHADGEFDVVNVARREIEEESGLASFDFWSASGELFDIDCHDIPQHGTEPAHIHFDLRFLVIADPKHPITVSEESHDVRWFTLAEARRLTDEASMHRQFDKIEKIFSR